MDEIVPNSSQPVVVQNPQPSFLSRYWKLLLGIFLAFIFVVALNYFNILALSFLSPKVLGFLPHKPFNQTFGNYLQASTNTKPAVLPYICPVDKKLCSSGEVFTISQSTPPLVGLGYASLASGSAVLAIASGSFDSGVLVDKNGNKTMLLSITNPDKNVEIDYRFNGTSYTPTVLGHTDVKPGDIIGWVNSQNLPQGLTPKAYSLIVSVQNLKNKDYLKLDPNDLVKATP